MKYERSSGILLHPTSFPSFDGIGDLGPVAYRWVNFLHESGCNLWQILPLGPTRYGNSPYQCSSAFAGNPYLVSSSILLEENLLKPVDLSDRPTFSENIVEYDKVINWKMKLLDRAFHNYKNSDFIDLNDSISEFQTKQSYWLEDFALFMAIKETQEGISWDKWPTPLKLREPIALKQFKHDYPELIHRNSFFQFLFFRQWNSLRRFANDKNIRIIGDIPIFVAYDSADAWAHPELFCLDEKRMPTVVAGVPPDYFSSTGQLWGNPLYRWEIHKQTGYKWWIQQFQSTMKIVDIIRLDHFCGFTRYWEIPTRMPTAEIGQWVPGPGIPFFDSIQQALGDLPLIAEDLGVITPDIIEMREKFQLPGMRVFQSAFTTDPSDPFLPHNYPRNCVAYTGTHDYDTAVGWYRTAPKKETDFCKHYLASSGEDISWDMIRAVWSSVAVMVLAPMQDFLRLGNEARMNYPGTLGGNWKWRMPVNCLDQELINQISEINYLYGRIHKPTNKPKGSKKFFGA